jgi:HAMP domain-containing protein
MARKSVAEFYEQVRRNRVVRDLGSLQLGLVCLVALFILVLAGTLYQAQFGPFLMHAGLIVMVAGAFQAHLYAAEGLVALVVVLVAAVAASVVQTVENQTSNLLEANRTDLASSSDSVNTAIRDVMLAVEAPITVSLLTDLAETLDDPVLEQVVATNTPRIIENLEKQQLEYYFPILNYSDCRVCHGTDHVVRGVAYYRVSLENVFDRINTARNTLLAFSGVTGIIIAILLIQLMQRIVIRPIRQIGDVVGMVGEGNLDVEADVRGSQEFDTLSEKINTMIDGLKEKSRLEVQNSVMQARDEETRKYLDNIAEGLLLLGRDHRVSEQYSKYLETLFGRSDIAGKTLPECVFPDPSRCEQEREELESERERYKSDLNRLSHLPNLPRKAEYPADHLLL